MSYINSNSSYNASMFYSTLSDYTQSINALNLTWDLVTEDFFNYYNKPHAWWTGYFTSRPLLKLTIRSKESPLKSSELLFLFASSLGYFPSPSLNTNGANRTLAMNNITSLRHAIDVTQHHDAITGTENDHTNTLYMPHSFSCFLRFCVFSFAILRPLWKFKLKRYLKGLKKMQRKECVANGAIR